MTVIDINRWLERKGRPPRYSTATRLTNVMQLHRSMREPAPSRPQSPFDGAA